MNAKELLVGDILREKRDRVITIRADENISAAAQLLLHNTIGLVVVLSEDLLFEGLLSERDIVRAVAATPERVATLTVGDLTTRDIIACGPEDTAAEVLGTMRAYRFRHMPVVENHKIRGIVSRTDFLDFLSPEEDVIEVTDAVA